MKIFIPLSFLLFICVSSIFIYFGSKDFTSYDDYLNATVSKDLRNALENQAKLDLFENFASYNDHLDLLTKNNTFYFTAVTLKKNDLVKINQTVNEKIIKKVLFCSEEELQRNTYNYADFTRKPDDIRSQLFYFYNCFLHDKSITRRPIQNMTYLLYTKNI